MRSLVLSDIHAEAGALESVLEHANGAWDRLLLLGDLIGYGPAPREAVARLRALSPAAAVRGNHEWMLARLSAGADVQAAPRVLDVLKQHRAELDENDLAWLSSLDEEHVEGKPEDGLQLVHGHTDRRRPFAYLISVPEARAAARHARRPLVLVGHTHVPGGFVEQDGRWRPVAARREETRVHVPLGDRAFLNPGSVAPARDGGSAPSYLIWDDAERSAVIHRLA